MSCQCLKVHVTYRYEALHKGFPHAKFGGNTLKPLRVMKCFKKKQNGGTHSRYQCRKRSFFVKTRLNFIRLNLKGLLTVFPQTWCATSITIQVHYKVVFYVYDPKEFKGAL